MTKQTIHDKPDFFSNRVLKKITIATSMSSYDVESLFKNLGVSKSQVNSWRCAPRNRHYEQLPREILDEFLESLIESYSTDSLITFICREIQATGIDKLTIQALDILIEKYRGEE